MVLVVRENREFQMHLIQPAFKFNVLKRLGWNAPKRTAVNAEWYTQQLCQADLAWATGKLPAPTCVLDDSGAISHYYVTIPAGEYNVL